MDNIKEKLVELLKEVVAIQECGFGDPRPTYQTVASYLIANGVTIQRWISVGERLPEESGRYLVCVNGYSSLYTKIAMFTPCYNGFEEHLKGRRIWFFYDSEYGDCELPHVSYWMQLPELPKGE